MGLINWIFDFYQHSKLERLQDEVRLRAGTGEPIELERVEAAIEQLALAVKTVQRIAVQKGLCTAEEFERTLAQIDLEDGRRDGRSPIV